MSPFDSQKVLVELFQTRTVVDFACLQEALGNVSVQTVFRYLKKIPYRRSYNHNGKYYTLHEYSRYNRAGLWSFKGIHFSVDGSLKNTVKRLVHESHAGKSHKELQEQLQTRTHNTLFHLYRSNEIEREEITRQFIYLHSDLEIRKIQVAKRHEMLEVLRFDMDEVTNEVVIQVLLILIRYPGSRIGDVARRLKGNCPPITMRHVEVVFQRYNLDDVEKKVE